MFIQSICLALALLDSHVWYIDTLYLSNDYSYAVLVIRKRDRAGLFINREQGPVDYLVCKSKVKSGQKSYRAQTEVTSNGVLTKGFTFNLNEYLSSALTSGSLDFSPAHVKIAGGCVVFYGQWIGEYGDFREGKTAFVIHQITSGARLVLKWNDVLDKNTLEKLSQKTLLLDEVVNDVDFANNVLGIELKKIDGVLDTTRIQKPVKLSK